MYCFASILFALFANYQEVRVVSFMFIIPQNWTKNHIARNIHPISEMKEFNSSAAFFRAFKKYFGVNASDMQNMVKSQYSKICKVESKNCKIKFTIEDYICNV